MSLVFLRVVIECERVRTFSLYDVQYEGEINASMQLD